MTILGFTGSRKGMTSPQWTTIMAMVHEFDSFQAHHGVCIGADREFHLIVRNVLPECWIVGHPPTYTKLMASLECDELRDPKEFHERDRAIVDECDTLLATPNTYQPVAHSGTWYTIGYAKQIGRKVIIVYPDGRVE